MNLEPTVLRTGYTTNAFGTEHLVGPRTNDEPMSFRSFKTFISEVDITLQSPSLFLTPFHRFEDYAGTRSLCRTFWELFRMRLNLHLSYNDERPRRITSNYRCQLTEPTDPNNLNYITMDTTNIFLIGYRLEIDYLFQCHTMPYDVKVLSLLMELRCNATNWTVHLCRDATNCITLLDSVIILNFNHGPLCQHKRNFKTWQGHATPTFQATYNFTYIIFNVIQAIWHYTTLPHYHGLRLPSLVCQHDSNYYLRWCRMPPSHRQHYIGHA